MLRTLIAIAWFPVVLIAQGVDSFGPSGQASIPTGSSTQRITLNLRVGPKSDDRFVLDASTIQLSVALLLPTGERIAANNARALGFSWFETDVEPPLGSTDGDRSTMIEFQRDRSAGTYVIELMARNLASPAEAFVQFIYDKQASIALIQSLPGFVGAGPVALGGASPSASLDIMLKEDEEGSMFDIVITNAAAKVTMTLPDGRTVDENTPGDAGLKWVKGAQPSARGFDPFMLPVEGMHHVVAFEKAAKGRYQIRAETQTPSTELTAAFIPLTRILTTATDQLEKLGQAPAGEVRLQAYGLPYDIFVGDPLELMVSFSGDPVADPISFETRTEYREILPSTGRGPAQFGPPIVEPVAATFRRTPEGRYTSTVIPARPGILRVGVSARGMTTGGQAFSSETLFTNITTHRVVARFQSLTEQGVDTDRSGTLDRLDITARLDVVLAGAYEMRLTMEDSDHRGTNASVRRTLAAGAQTLTVSIPAVELRSRLKDGLWTIRDVQIFHPIGNTFGDFVAGLKEGFALTTAAYRRDQWDRGPAWVGESLTSRGIRPAASGRFRMIEFQWPVFTPGGKCQWGLSLDGEYFSAGGTLPKGAVTLSLVVDAARVAAASKRQWDINPILNCDFPVRDDFRGSLRTISLDPSQFEPKREPFHIRMHSMLRMASGQSAVTGLDVPGKTADQVTFEVSGMVPGIQVDVPARGQPGGDVTLFVDVEIAPGTRPGRYFFPITATSNGQKATADLVIDVVN